MAANTDPTKVLVGEARLSYCYLFEPQKSEGSDKDSYSVSLIIPKSNTALVEKIRTACKAAAQAGAGLWGGKIPAGLHNPLNDGDEKRPDDPAYQGAYYMNAKTSRKPFCYSPGPVVNGQRTFTPITDPEQVYSGCYGFASVRFYAYNRNGNKGIAAALDSVVKVRDGERLGGGAEAPEVAYSGVDFTQYEPDLPEDDFLR